MYYICWIAKGNSCVKDSGLDLLFKEIGLLFIMLHRRDSAIGAFLKMLQTRSGAFYCTIV